MAQRTHTDQTTMTDCLPEGLVPGGASPIFTQDTIPDALQSEHALAPGRWGVLHVFEGRLRFVNLETGEEHVISAPGLITIHPQAPHRVAVDGPLRCRIDFFRDLDADSETRPPGWFADEEVRLSFERCEAHGDFAETFYAAFMNSSPEIAPYFGQTDFARQHRVLRDSVHMMVSRDVADPEFRSMLTRLGTSHSREGRSVLPKLYELWLDSICEVAKALDPDWSDELERKWRVRLRAGMQLIMAAY